MASFDEAEGVKLVQFLTGKKKSDYKVSHVDGAEEKRYGLHDMGNLKEVWMFHSLLLPLSYGVQLITQMQKISEKSYCTQHFQNFGKQKKTFNRISPFLPLALHHLNYQHVPSFRLKLIQIFFMINVETRCCMISSGDFFRWQIKCVSSHFAYDQVSFERKLPFICHELKAIG